MLTDEMDLLRGIAPPADSPLYTTEQREALLAATIATTRTRPSAASRHPVRTWGIRLSPLAAGAAAAVAVVVMAGGTSGTAAGGPAGHAHRAPAAQVQTVAQIQHRAVLALALARHGTLRVKFTDRYGTDRTTQNLASGATREIWRNRAGKIVSESADTGPGRKATATFIDFGQRVWWNARGGFGSEGRALTSVPTLRQQLAAGALTMVGHDTVAGQPTIHLRYRADVFMVLGRKYFVSMKDVWVSAKSFLPLRYAGHGAVTDLSWSPKPPTTAEVTAVPPAGFKHLSGPPA